MDKCLCQNVKLLLSPSNNPPEWVKRGQDVKQVLLTKIEAQQHSQTRCFPFLLKSWLVSQLSVVNIYTFILTIVVHLRICMATSTLLRFCFAKYRFSSTNIPGIHTIQSFRAAKREMFGKAAGTILVWKVWLSFLVCRGRSSEVWKRWCGHLQQLADWVFSVTT